MARVEKQRVNKTGKSVNGYHNHRALLKERGLPEFLIRFLGYEKLKNLNLKQETMIQHYRRD